MLLLIIYVVYIKYILLIVDLIVDLIKLLTCIVQYIHNARLPIAEGLMYSPGADNLRISFNSGQLTALKIIEEYIRKMAVDLENDNFNPPSISSEIKPLGNYLSQSNINIRKEMIYNV